MKKAFDDPSITVDQLDALMNKFIEAVKNDTYEQEGFQKSTYGVSKVKAKYFSAT